MNYYNIVTMIVYLESVIINNFCINTLILYTTLITNKARVIWWRVILATLIGVAYSIALPYIQFAGDIVIKFLLGAVMCFIARKWIGVKKYLTLLFTFYVITFGLGGAVIALTNMYLPLKAALLTPNSINAALISTLAILLLVASRKIIQTINKKRIKEKNVKRVIINSKQKILKEKAYYDSGNTLYFNGIYPVIVLDESLSEDVNKSVGEIKLSTLTGEKKMPVFRIEEITVDNRRYDSVYCIFNKLNNGYKVLLHNDTY